MPLRRLHRPLVVTAAAMALLTVVGAVGLAVDDRTLTGAPIWLKPLKFAVSLTVYTLTLAWLLSLLTRRTRIGWWLGTVIAAAAVVEMVVIVGQVVRGRASHFNVATPLDAALFSLMGATIVVVWLATAAIGALLLRQPIGDRPTGRAVRLSLPIALAGLAVGFLMTSPTAQQRAAMADAPPATVGAHSVGVADGGPGLPLVNWSTGGGDLRIGHFVGMHALQALPLLALGLALVGRRVRRLRDERVRTRLVTVAAGGYAGLTLLLTWQALRGQALVAPDAATLAAAAALAAATLAAAGWALSTRAAPDLPVDPALDPAPDPALDPALTAGLDPALDPAPAQHGAGTGPAAPALAAAV
jgi:hypothetical protein